MQYIKGAALPNFQDTWTDAEDVAIDFASGYTFSGKLYDPSNDVVWFTKTSGFTGAASAPNIAVAWDATELNIDAGDYVFYVTATRTSDSKKYKTAYGLTIAADGEASIYTPPPGLYGVPEGGTAEQVLAKASADDGDTYWKTIVSDAVQSVVSGTGITVDNTDPQNPIISATGKGVPAGGTEQQLLSKATGTDYDTEWVDPPTSGIDPDTEENLLSSTPDGSGYVIATDTLRGLYYNADNTQWYITSIPLSTELANPDAGYTQDSDKRGYGDDYIYGKRLYAASLGDYTDEPVPGAIKVTHTTNPPLYQIYLRGRWNTLFYDLTMERGDFEHVPINYPIDVRSGNSNMTGLNGQPIIREYKVDAGAYPRPAVIDGGILA